jgi:hypothetical protein
MTKVTILGQSEPEQKELKPIEFLYYLSGALPYSCPSESKPGSYKNIELICMNYGGSRNDLMYAYDTDRNQGSLYLGQFNDGVVE